MGAAVLWGSAAAAAAQRALCCFFICGGAACGLAFLAKAEAAALRKLAFCTLTE